MLVYTVALTLLSSGRVFHASPSGSDANSAATAEEPLQTLCACVSSLAHAGDECRLHTGNYTAGTESCSVTNLKGTSTDPIIIASAGDGRVVIDGTVPISGPWTKEGGGWQHRPAYLFIHTNVA